MSSVGSLPDEQVYIDQFPDIFVEDVAKIENGKIIVKGKTALLHQLHDARAFIFPWDMEVLDIVSDDQNHVAAVRFSWNSEKIGLHLTTAILKFDEDGKIFEINEVYNKFAGVAP